MADQPPKNKDQLIKAVLFSDIHLDFEYTPGMSNNCGRPQCCRASSGRPRKESEAAGKWGDF